MNGFWDIKADAVEKGDNLRDVSPLVEKTWKDEEGFTHYIFNSATFHNPWYSISDDDYQLFQDYIRGGSRPYPSDGNIPCDIVAGEARNVLKKIETCATNPDHYYCEEAKSALKSGKLNLVRGTLKLYLGKYTSRDWRRKRFTDDIDFWTFQTALLDSTLKECGFNKNKKSGEWEKIVNWKKSLNEEARKGHLYAANNLNQILDFGAGAYLSGASLKDIFDKKIKRGHDVDLSDIINVAMINDGKEGKHKVEWNDAWKSFEEATNTRNSRITSNLISLCRYSLSIADYFDNLKRALQKYNDDILNKSKFSDEEIYDLTNISIHWRNFCDNNGIEETRKMIHEFYHQQLKDFPIYAKNLRHFSEKILKLLNSKYEYLKIIFEIER
jgi:hypothetical protein